MAPDRMTREAYVKAFDRALERYKLLLIPSEEEQLRADFASQWAYNEMDEGKPFSELQWAADIYVNAITSYRRIAGIRQ
jgi:hypothetical protein